MKIDTIKSYAHIKGAYSSAGCDCSGCEIDVHIPFDVFSSFGISAPPDQSNILLLTNRNTIVSGNIIFPP